MKLKLRKPSPIVSHAARNVRRTTEALIETVRNAPWVIFLPSQMRSLHHSVIGKQCFPGKKMLCERGGASIHAVFEQTVLKFFLPRDPSTSSLSFYTPTEEVYTQSWQAKRGLGFSGVSLEERKGYISLGVLLTGSWDPDRRRDSGKAINDMAFFCPKENLRKRRKTTRDNNNDHHNNKVHS